MHLETSGSLPLQALRRVLQRSLRSSCIHVLSSQENCAWAFQCLLQLDWGLVWLPRSPPLPALVWLGGSRGRTVVGWRQQEGCDIGGLSAHGTGYSSGSSASFLVFFSSSSSGFGHVALFLAVCSFPCFSHPPAPYSQSHR